MPSTTPTSCPVRRSARGRPRTPSICSRPPPAEASGRRRHETIEARGFGVLGLVDDARRRIDGDRFVHEAAHGGERLRARSPVQRHFEDVAVRPGQRGVHLRPQHRLLAGQPRAPRSRAAGAVAYGAGQPGPGAHQALGSRIEAQQRRAAAGGGVVDTRRRERRPGDALVVAHQGDQAVGAGERGHAVVGGRRRESALERIGSPPHRSVAEARGQLDERQARGLVGDRRQRAVAIGRRRAAVAPGRVGQRLERLHDRRRPGQQPATQETSARIEHWRSLRQLCGQGITGQ